jgi:predicted XRE-type DNA-binding protein
VTERAFESVWDAIEDAPEAAENMKLRSLLMSEIEGEIGRRGWTQAEAAAALGITQPRVSDLVRGKIGLFSIDALVAMASAMGRRIEVRFVDTSASGERGPRHDAAGRR